MSWVRVAEQEQLHISNKSYHLNEEAREVCHYLAGRTVHTQHEERLACAFAW